jgi:PBP1b-binding outer membrane lipoprotein LpoB
MWKKLIFITAVIAVMSACSTGTNVRRVDSERQIDLSGYWNDTDVRIVCEALIRDFLSSPRVAQELSSRNTMPTVIVGRFRNESSEHIDTAIISSIMETAIFNSGRLNFVAGGGVREDLRAERLDQQSHASAATMAALRNETGADFMLTGTVRTIIDRDRNQTVRTYFVRAEMTNIETNQLMWIGENNEIKKIVTQPRNRL